MHKIGVISPINYFSDLLCSPSPPLGALQEKDLENELVQLKGLFSMLDKDGNGTLSADEVRNHIKNYNQLT